jgi:cyclohexanone monooxygenase
MNNLYLQRGSNIPSESYIYMPMLEETNYIPTEKYAKAPELLAHARRIGEKFDLYTRAMFHTEVNKMTWDESAARWVCETNRGDKIRARFAASASGPLNMPKLPGVEGIEKFKGHSFHTSRWDYAYTGGTLHGKLDKLGDKKIGFIGTGATAIQAVPHLGEGVQKGETGRLYVFQRTPSSVSRRNNRPTDPEWAKSLQSGWHENRQENFLRVMYGSQEEDLVSDGWTTFARWMKENGLKRGPNLFKEFAALFEFADMQNMERIRARCDEIVKDQNTAAALKPWYRQFCKRPCFHDEYLDTYNLSNVTLVDTDGQGIDRITEKGIVAGGKEYELDCIVYGTGFEVGTSYQRRSNFKVFGRNGLTLSEKWEEGPTTLHGFFVREFPNYFVISTLHSGFAANFVHMLGRQAKHIAWIIKTCKERNIKTIETTAEAEEKWTDEIVNGLGTRRNVEVQKSCTPGYYNLEGQISESLKAKRKGNYAAGPLAFCTLLENWREKGDLEGLEVTTYDTALTEETGILNATNGVNGTHNDTHEANDTHTHETNGTYEVQATNGVASTNEINGDQGPKGTYETHTNSEVNGNHEVQPINGTNGTSEANGAHEINGTQEIIASSEAEVTKELQSTLRIKGGYEVNGTHESDTNGVSGVNGYTANGDVTHANGSEEAPTVLKVDGP